MDESDSKNTDEQKWPKSFFYSAPMQKDSSGAYQNEDYWFRLFDRLLKWERKDVFEFLLEKSLETDLDGTKENTIVYEFSLYGKKILELRFHAKTQDDLLKQTPGAISFVRSLFMHVMLTMSKQSVCGYLALERAIISDHERKKVEKRHRKGAKAKFQQMAIGQWVSLKRKESKRNFAIKFSLFLSSQHNIQLNPDTIAEDWLKGH